MVKIIYRSVLCKCGCGEYIKWKSWYKYSKVPMFIWGHNTRGTKRKNTEEHNRNISKGKIGIKHTEEHNNNVSKALIGRTFTKEHNNNISLSKMGKNNPMYGRPVSAETRKKKSDALKGRPTWNKGLTKDTDERLKSMSDSKLGGTPWNKGKTKYTDERLKAYSENVSHNEHLNRVRVKQAHHTSSIEIKVRKYLKKLNVEFYTNIPDLPGQPDIIIPNNDTFKHIAIFIDGCYWHCCKECFDWSDKDYAAFEYSIEKRHYDKLVNDKLLSNGFIVYRIWEHDVKNKNYKKIIKNIINGVL